jgi:hypothetical protein
VKRALYEGEAAESNAVSFSYDVGRKWGARQRVVLLALLFGIRSYGQTFLLGGPPQLRGTALMADDSAPALAFGRYLASIQARNPFTEAGPICMEVDALFLHRVS